MSSKQKKETKQQLIYIGPNLPGGRLIKYTVFKGGVPPYLDDLLGKHPEVSDLIVPVTSLYEGQVKSQEVGTVENIAYTALSQLSR